jgi:membrane protease YdiL (CAAX protease family)
MNRNNSLSFFLFLALVFFVWALRATVFYWIDESIADSTVRLVYATALKFALWVLPAVAFAALVRRQPPLQYLGLATNPSRREWLVALLAVAGYLAAVTAFEVLLNGKHWSFASVSLVGLAFLFVSSAIEEILFRGLILKELLNTLSPLAANIVTSLLFVAIHWPYWLWSRGLTTAVFADTLGVFLISLLLGWIYLRTKSVWPCIVAHTLNNVVAGALAAGAR